MPISRTLRFLRSKLPAIVGAAWLAPATQAPAGATHVTFGPPVFVYSNVTAPIGIGVGDLNLDGRLDAAGTYFGMVVYHNQQGTLVADDGNVLPFNAPFEPHVRIADLTGDGLPDIVASAAASNLTIFAQQPDGLFRGIDTGIDGGTYQPKFALGRFNDDALPDVVIHEPFGVFLNLGAGRFVAVTEPVVVPVQQSQVLAGRLDNDDLDDVITIGGFPTTAHVFRNLGRGELSLTAEYEIPASVLADELATLGDFNGDGLADLALATSKAENNQVHVRLGQPDATLGQEMLLPLGSGLPQTIATGDVNGDGSVDIAVAMRTGRTHVLLGAGDGSFTDAGQTAPILTSGPSGLPLPPLQITDLFIADITGDYRNDLVMAVVGYGLVVVPNTTPQPTVGDVNGDGVVDVDDLIAVILAWGACPTPPAPCLADVNHSGAVDVDDLIAVILNWG